MKYVVAYRTITISDMEEDWQYRHFSTEEELNNFIHSLPSNTQTYADVEKE